MDYYELLGLKKGASDAEIKAAYRKQALKWHPDRNKAPDAATKFKDINKAYEVLANSQKRQMYDQYGKEGFERGGFGSHSRGAAGQQQQGPFSYTYSSSGGGNPFDGADFGGTDPFDIFEQFFGFGGGGRGGARKRRDVYQMELTFMDAVRGVTKETVIKGKNHSIKIPAGVDDGMKIRFEDFDVLVRVKSDVRFKRDGQDVYVNKNISFPMATLGGEITVNTLDGDVTLRVRPGTKSGTTVRLRGHGIVFPQQSHNGDLYVQYTIEVPERLSSKAKKLLEELQKEWV
jgi:DnaJ-class molecular chaperone